ncbi:MAG: DNA integrity scanning protein DisA nucleotide-binding domain protein [Deltaproteobacteria bacterium]|nr:DNA integrity scanning protein DisA nucleotide-binding domain protein [Deltaproteobacteria bacterium]
MIEVLSTVLSALGDGFVGFFQRTPWDVIHDCLDIGLVAVLIYWALVILRGTRAMQVAIGLCLVFVGYLFVRRAGLVTVTTILDSVLAYLAIIVVIIFQSDIRRALARMGRRPLLRGQRTAKETQTIEEVIKAVGTLAQKRIGALVAFERGAALDEFIERGTEVDAAVSKELLHSIFVPSFENPMHDGAVVLREGRIWQAPRRPTRWSSWSAKSAERFHFVSTATSSAISRPLLRAQAQPPQSRRPPKHAGAS